jgi:SAM-dependent methyltransferase
MSSGTPTTVTTANAEAIEAWDGPLFERFVAFRHLLVDGLGLHGEAALRAEPPQPGERVIDLGCGFGDTTQRIAGMVGPQGEAVGLDAAPRFIETATRETAEAGIANASFRVADLEAGPIDGGPYDRAFSRMGTMFFANPVAALRNVRKALRPGGRLTMVVWRRREDNAWVHRAQQIVEGIVSRPEEYDEPTCGPGPFSMAGADTTSDLLLYAGWENVGLRRSDLPLLMGRDLDEAVDLVMAIGPAGEILRLQGDRAAHLHDTVRDALKTGLAEYDGPNGVWAPASTWIVTATAPA